MIQFKKLLIASMCTFLLAACWDRVELNDVGIVTGIAVEKGEKYKYKMSVEVLNATENSKMEAQGNAPSTVYTQEGNSLSELSHRMNVGASRQLVYSHTRVFLIDESVAKDGVLEFLDFLERSGEFRNDFNILLFEGGSASSGLQVTYPILKVSSLKINKQIESFYKDWGGDPNVRLTDFISALTSPGREPTIAIVRVNGDGDKGSKVENMQNVKPDALIEVSGLAIFEKDKLVGKLSNNATRNYLWLNKLKSTSITIPCEGEDDRFLDLRIINAHSSIKSSIKNGAPHFLVRINAEAKIEGSQCTKNLERIDTYELFEKNVKDHLEKEISDTIKEVQEEYKTDIFGFGEVLQRQHYKEFQKMKDDWNSHFSDSTVDINAKIFIRRSGIRNQNIITELKTE